MPRIIITAQGQPPPDPKPRPLRTELVPVIQAYDRIAESDLRTQGTAGNYRKIRPVEWPPRFNMYYEFCCTRGVVGVELHLENSQAAPLGSLLSQLAGRKFGPSQSELQWDPKWSSGRGRLMVRHAPTEPPDTIAKSMLDLISLTREAVTKRAAELSKRLCRPMVLSS